MDDKDPMGTAAAIDSLVHHSVIVEWISRVTGLRMPKKRKIGSAAQSLPKRGATAQLIHLPLKKTCGNVENHSLHLWISHWKINCIFQQLTHRFRKHERFTTVPQVQQQVFLIF